jgi:hypothetical protein
MDDLLLTQIQANLLALEIEVNAAAEKYPANWRENGGEVYRDPTTGQFASPAGGDSSSEDSTSTESTDEQPSQYLEDILEQKTTTINKKLKEFEKQQVETVQESIVKTIEDRLNVQLEKRKELAGEVTNLMFGDKAKEARKALAKLTRPISATLSNAVEEDPFEEIKGDIAKLTKQANAENLGSFAKDFPKALKYAGTKYNAITAELKASEGDEKMLHRALGTAMAIAAPATVAMAAIVGPWTVVPAIAGAAVMATSGGATGIALTAGGVATVGSWIAAHEVVFRATNEVFDELGVENPVLRGVYNFGLALASPLGMADVFYRSTRFLAARDRPNLTGKTPQEMKALRVAQTEATRKLSELTKKAEEYDKEVQKTLAQARELAKELDATEE